MSQRVSDEKLSDWDARWPSTLPTSVPHEQVRMLIADLRDARAEIAALKASLAVAKKNAEYLMQIIADLTAELEASP